MKYYISFIAFLVFNRNILTNILVKLLCMLSSLLLLFYDIIWTIWTLGHWIEDDQEMPCYATALI